MRSKKVARATDGMHRERIGREGNVRLGTPKNRGRRKGQKKM